MYGVARNGAGLVVVVAVLAAGGSVRAQSEEQAVRAIRSLLLKVKKPVRVLPGTCPAQQFRPPSEPLGSGAPCATPDRVVAALKAACDGGGFHACDQLGVMHARGLGVPRDTARAAALFKQACDGGNISGCTDLAVACARGVGLRPDMNKALALLDRGCRAQDADACHEYADVVGSWSQPSLRSLGDLLMGTVMQGMPDLAKPAYYEAGGLYRKACDGGDANACAKLGSMAQNGEGADADLQVATALYAKACDRGSADGCAHLGDGYAIDSVAEDLPYAAGLYNAACKAGSGLGCVRLGDMARDGVGGVPQDAAKEGLFYAMACDAGNALGCLDLGQMAAGPQARVHDPDLVVDLYRRACDYGETRACNLLATTGMMARMVPQRAAPAASAAPSSAAAPAPAHSR